MNIARYRTAGKAQAPKAVGYLCGYMRAPEAITPACPVEEVAVTVNILGIPENELTPRIRDAIMALMAEVEGLRRTLRRTQSQLEELEQMAKADPLLPILNRHAFVHELTRQIGYSARYKTPASLIYFDLDGFKGINDTYGHAAGDAVLAHFTDTLMNHVRDSDIVSRLGGDEFGIILLQSNQELAHKKVHTLADTLAATPARWKDKLIGVDFSYGALELLPGENAESVMARADDAMYAHKIRTKRSARDDSSTSK